MRYSPSSFLPFLLTSTLSFALPRTIYQFPNPTWLENIFATSNGSLLTSTLGGLPELHLITPSPSSPATASLLYTFPGADSVFSITELSPNIFAVITGNYSTSSGPVIGSSSVWTVDLTYTKSPKSKFHKVADLETTQLLNGAAALNPHTVLLADSFAGNVVAIDVRSGRYDVVIEDKSLAADFNYSLPIGVNGLKVVGGYLYYSNTVQGTVNRVKVDTHTGRPVGAFQRIANVTQPDDLAVVDDGTVVQARPIANVVDRVLLNGTVTRLAGGLNDSTVAGVTSVTLGRAWWDRSTAYVATNGGLSGPVNGTFVEGGKVVALSIV